MTSALDLKQERELLAGLGLGPVRIWPVRCMWYKADGSSVGPLPCDPYSRIMYMDRGLRPEVAGEINRTSKPASTTLLDAVSSLMEDWSAWEGTASELMVLINDATIDKPADATRLSKELNILAASLSVRGIAVERIKTSHRRAIRLVRR